MACEMGRTELAEEIQEAVHAGKVKHLSKGIADDTERWQWERENTDVIKEILEVKADQCEQFRQCLLENCDTVLAEDTPSKIWASGLSPWATEHTDHSYWPGKNMIGAMLMEISAKLSAKLSSEDSGEPMQTGRPTVSEEDSSSNRIAEEDSSNHQEDTDDEIETTEADFFDAEADTEVENELETQYPSSTLNEKSSTSSYAGKAPPARNNTLKSDTNNKDNKQSTDKTTQNKPNQSKNNPKKSITKGDKSKVRSKKGAPKTPKQQDIRNAMEPDTPKQKEMASSPEGTVSNDPKSLKHDDEKG